MAIPCNLSLKTSNFDSPDDEDEVVCLGVQIDGNDQAQDMRVVLQSIRNIYSFTDVDHCIKHITARCFSRIFLIVSDRRISSILPQVEGLGQIVSVFILCENSVLDEFATICPEKCRGVFRDKDRLLSFLEEHIIEQTSLLSTINWSSFEGTNQQSFLPFNDTRAWNILSDLNRIARADIEDSSRAFEKQQMVRECLLQFKNDPIQLQRINEFAQTYNRSEAIKWYTKNSFLYQIVNKVIRSRCSANIDKYRFYIKDLEESLDLFFAKQTLDHWSSSSTLRGHTILRVYRGQTLSYADVKQLQSLRGQRMIMSQYTSTTKSLDVAKMFAGVGDHISPLESVIYEIDMNVIYESYTDKPDPTVFYYDISNLNDIRDEEEVLLRVGTVFQLLHVDKSTDGSWHVILRLEKVDDYRSATTAVHRTPAEVVGCFFRKASQWRNINLENIPLSADTILRMSVFIRLGHLVRHHPREQLQYYQLALACIPSSELALQEVGYWAIRMRCISNVNDWTSVPVNIYRQTVFHVRGNLKNQLNRELARIDEARGAFRSAARYCRQISKHSNDRFEKQLMSSEIERLNKKADDLQPVLPPGQIAHWYLYVTVLTPDERSMIDHQCKMFHQCIDKRYLSKNFTLSDILPNIDRDEYPDLTYDGLEDIDFSSLETPTLHLFIKTVTDNPLELDLDRNTTLGQLKEKIRGSFDLPYPANYDFRLIYLGSNLTNEENSLYDYDVYDRCVMYVVHGPHIQHQPMNRLLQELYENTGLNSSNVERIVTTARMRIEKQEAELQKMSDTLVNINRNWDVDGIKSSESVNRGVLEFFSSTTHL